MNALSSAHAELRLLVDGLCRECERLAAANASHMQWDNHRSDAIGAIWRALDRVEPGLGLRLVRAMYPDLPRVGAETVFHDVAAEARRRAHSFDGALARRTAP